MGHILFIWGTKRWRYSEKRRRKKKACAQNEHPMFLSLIYLIFSSNFLIAMIPSNSRDHPGRAEPQELEDPRPSPADRRGNEPKLPRVWLKTITFIPLTCRSVFLLAGERRLHTLVLAAASRVPRLRRVRPDERDLEGVARHGWGWALGGGMGRGGLVLVLVWAGRTGKCTMKKGRTETEERESMA